MWLFHTVSNFCGAFVLKLRGGTFPLSVPDFQCNDSTLEQERDGVRENDGQRIDPDALDEPQQHTRTEYRHHSPGQIAG